MCAAKNNTFIGAFLDGELVGFIQLLYGDNIAIISNILSLQQHWDKSLNNALFAKAVEVCVSQRANGGSCMDALETTLLWTSLKKIMGSSKFPITRYYVPITGKGRLAIRLGLHRDLKDALPNFVKYPLIPALNWMSRTKVKIKHR